MNKWVLRLIGILIVIIFLLAMLNLQKQLVMLQKERQPATTSTAPH